MTVTFRKTRFDRSLVVGTWLVVGGATLPFGCAGRSDSKSSGGTGGQPDGTYHSDNVSYDGNGNKGGTAGGMVSDGRSQGGKGGSAGTEPRGGFSGGGFTSGGVSGSGLISYDGGNVDGRLDGYHDGRSVTDGFHGGGFDGGHPSDGRDGFARDDGDGFAPDGFGPDGDRGDGDPGGDGTSWSDGAP